MTREELEKMLESYIPNTGGDWKEAIVDAMVGAYNKALEDAAENAEVHYPPGNNLNPTVDRESILKLKLD